MGTRTRLWGAFYLPAALIDFALYANLFALESRASDAGAGQAGLARLVATYIGVYVFASLMTGRVLASGARDRNLVTACGALAALFALGTRTAGLLEFQATLAVTGVFSAVFWTSTQAKLGDESTGDLGGALGGFNLAWSGGKALGLFGAGSLYQWSPRAPFVVAAAGASIACALNIAFGKRFSTTSAKAATQAEPQVASPQPGAAVEGKRQDASPAASEPHSRGPARAVDQRTKRRFLRTALTANFLGYGVNALAVALVPELGRSLHISPTIQSACLAFTTGGQLAGFAVLGRSRSWTYRALPLLLMEAVFALASFSLGLARTWPLLLPGLFIYGAAQSIAYASSLFYSLDFDERRHARTGVHEAMLGIGGFAIPLAGGELGTRLDSVHAPYLMAGGLIATVAAAHAVYLAGSGATSPPASSADARASRLETSAEPRT